MFIVNFGEVIFLFPASNVPYSMLIQLLSVVVKLSDKVRNPHGTLIFICLAHVFHALVIVYDPRPSNVYV